MIRHRGTGYPCQRAQAVPSVGVAKEKFCERHTHFFSQPSFSHIYCSRSARSRRGQHFRRIPVRGWRSRHSRWPSLLMLEACTKQPLHIVIRVCTCADVCLCVHPTAGSSLSTLHDEPQESRFRTNLNKN